LSSALTPQTPILHYAVNWARHTGTISIDLIWRARSTILAFCGRVGPPLKWLSLDDLDAAVAIGIKTCSRALANDPIAHHAILNHQLRFLPIGILDFVVNCLSDLEKATHLSLQLFALVVALLEFGPQLFAQFAFEL
jgi:hypothetical protein